MQSIRCGLLLPVFRGLYVCCVSVTTVSLTKRLNRSRCRLGYDLRKAMYCVGHNGHTPEEGGSLNRVPASAGVRAGMSPLPGGR